MMADSSGSTPKPDSDVYTVLVMVGTIFLVVGTVVVCMRAQSVFGSWMPFSF